MPDQTASLQTNVSPPVKHHLGPWTKLILGVLIVVIVAGLASFGWILYHKYHQPSLGKVGSQIVYKTDAEAFGRPLQVPTRRSAIRQRLRTR